MKQLRRIGVPVFVVAAILLVFPALELLQAIWPFKVGTVAWRAGAIGLLSRTLLTPIIALFLAYSGALLLENARALRVLAVVNAAIALLLTGGLVLYAMDALQLRSQLTPQAKSAYDLGMALSFVKFAIADGFLVTMAVIERRAALALARGTSQSAPAPAVTVRRASRTPGPAVGDVPIFSAEASARR